MSPHVNWPMASARLIIVMPRPVELLSGETKSPIDCRAPIVTMRIAAAAMVTMNALRALAFAISGLMRDSWRSWTGLDYMMIVIYSVKHPSWFEANCHESQQGTGGGQPGADSRCRIEVVSRTRTRRRGRRRSHAGSRAHARWLLRPLLVQGRPDGAGVRTRLRQLRREMGERLRTRGG